MSDSKHGFIIGVERTQTDCFITMKAIGTLTHKDYETITPLFDDALSDLPKTSINVLVDVTEFEGWELRAMWDDFKIGLKHGHEFNRVAMLGSKHWQEIMSKIGSWFIDGEIKYFEDLSEALDWLHET
jgi:hypothetical protein